jgi:hypothetical protein
MKQIFLMFAALLCAAPAVAQEDCPEGNLLAGKQPIEWLDVYHVSRITDGVVSPDGGAWDSSTNSPLTPFGYAIYDLGMQTRIASVFLQVEGSSSYRIGVSEDGVSWTLVSHLPPAGGGGMRERRASALATPARYLRISAGDEQALYAIGEAGVWCRPPSEWPPRFEIRDGTVQDAEWSARRKTRLGYAKLVCLALAAGLFFAAWRFPGRRRWLYGAVAVLGAFAWTHFGTFHGNGVIHYHENYHYYMGAEYFEENRYTGLYACTVWAEKELGLEASVRNRYVTDLENNRLVPGAELLEVEPACRQRFDDARWASFREDVRFFRNNLYPGSWQRIFRDHGYNATPVWTMGGKAASAGGPAADAVPRVVRIDAVLWLGIGALILWGFGWEALALAFLTLGCGLPWHFDWTGGAFARTPWLFLLVAGACLLKKDRPFTAGFFLATAGLLRVFPAVFLGVLLLGGLVAILRRRATRDVLRCLAGAGIAVLLLLGFSMVFVGADSWTGFASNLNKHAGTPTGNLMGLPTIVAFEPGSSQSEILGGDIESLERWRAARLETLRERRVVAWPLAALAVALCAWSVFRRKWPAWEWVVSATLLAVTLGQISSYYYVFLILLAPWIAGRPLRITLLIVCLGGSQIIGLAGLETDVRFLWLSIVFVALPAALWVARIREKKEPATA